MKILIASGIYPPDIGGPAQYARNLYETWKKQGHDVKVAAYRWERIAPPGLRHLLYFTKIIRKGWNADLVLVLDTWSAAVPTMAACALMRKKYVVRTGGDFLWESYVERTGDMILFKDFYGSSSSDFVANCLPKLSRKERMIFKLGGDSLRKAKTVIFSTEWQKGIFGRAYGLDQRRCAIVENYCGERLEPTEPDSRTFVAATRDLKWKNIDLLKASFKEAQAEVNGRGLSDIELDCGKAVYDSFVEKIHHAYAVALVSIGDISPNMIFDAIRAGTPFILTKENGIADRVKDAAILVDPLNKKEISEKIVWLSDPANRAAQAEKVRKIAFTHSWEEIGKEIVDVWKKPDPKRGFKR
jgi:glycosyltransferase involved in cell wall biosynthesis